MKIHQRLFGLFLLANLCIGSACQPLQSQIQAPSTELLSGDLAETASEAAAKVFLGADHGVVMYGFDCLAHPNEPVDLVVKAQKGQFLRDLEEVTISFHHQDTLLGTVKTDDEGVAIIRWQPPGPGDYDITAQIIGAGDHDPEILRVAPAPILIMVRPPEAKFVVIDLDHTLVDDGFLKVLAGGGRPMAGSIEVTQKLKEHYDILYLTHRPDLLTRTSKGWLRRHGYPAGPLLVSTMRDVFGGSGEYKTARLATLQQAFPRLHIGIGDKISDALAYVDNGMEAYLIPHYDTKEAEDIRDMARDIGKLRKIKKLQVVSGWSQIEAGIFEGKHYSAREFASWLEKQADELERREKQKKHTKEEEDDD